MPATLLFHGDFEIFQKYWPIYIYTIQKFLNAKNPEQSFVLFLVNTVGAFQWDKIVLI